MILGLILPMLFPPQVKFGFLLIHIIVKWLLQNFVHDMTVMLSQQVEKFGTIWIWQNDLHWNQNSIKFQSFVKLYLWVGPVLIGVFTNPNDATLNSADYYTLNKPCVDTYYTKLFF